MVVSVAILGSIAPQQLPKKVAREVEKAFGTAVDIQAVSVPDSVNEELEIGITGENFVSLTREGKLLGYAFMGTAPSKTAKFDYLVLFDGDVRVLLAKVLAYREEYGGEIGSHRWLSQFEGLSGTDRVSTDTNIDAISGATISVRSMTRSMDKLLQTIGQLQRKNLL